MSSRAFSAKLSNLTSPSHNIQTLNLHELTMSSAANAKQTPVAAPLKPVDILQTQIAQSYAHLHPILLLSGLLLSFRSLVHDPVNTLLGLAPTVTILQAVYCVLCLPIPGQAAKSGQKKKASKQSQDIWSKIVVCTSYARALSIAKLSRSQHFSLCYLRSLYRHHYST